MCQLLHIYVLVFIHFLCDVDADGSVGGFGGGGNSKSCFLDAHVVCLFWGVAI